MTQKICRDRIITGTGTINGNPVVFTLKILTVMGGSLDSTCRTITKIWITPSNENALYWEKRFGGVSYQEGIGHWPSMVRFFIAIPCHPG
jgi:acetyl-CoA carboxylase carboxyltransferase component